MFKIVESIIGQGKEKYRFILVFLNSSFSPINILVNFHIDSLLPRDKEHVDTLIRQEIRTHSSPINTFTHDRILINTLASRHTSYRFVDGKSEEMYYAYVNSKIQKNDRSSMNFVKTCNIYQSPK